MTGPLDPPPTLSDLLADVITKNDALRAARATNDASNSASQVAQAQAAADAQAVDAAHNALDASIDTLENALNLIK